MASTHSEPAKMEQIITEFFAKSLHIILESRCPCAASSSSFRNYSGDQLLLASPSPSSTSSTTSSSSSSFRARDKWFNLALRDCPAALENIDFWRQSNFEPLVIDVVLVQRPSGWDPGPSPGVAGNCCSSPRRVLGGRNFLLQEGIWNSEGGEFGGCKGKSEKIIERWVVTYESRKNCRDNGLGSKRLSSTTSSHALYKKSILLLRSLYLTVRLLPAYKLFRGLNSSGQIPTFSLTHRVSSFVEPFTRREEVDMQRFAFTPVDTSCGRLCISVLYRSSVSDVSSETSTPMSPRFIPDYVGSPLADPLKRLPSLPMPQSSPSSAPFGRRHSWSYDMNRTSPSSAYPSPSPTYSESRASLTKPGSARPPPTILPYHLSEPPQVPYQNTSYDEYWPSPSFSPSSSPSPPTHVPRSHLSKALLRSDSAPVNIPASRLGDAPLLSNKQNLAPSPPLKATRPYNSKLERSSTSLQTGSTIEKLLSLGKDDTGRPSGLKITSDSSPPKSFSRSSSRLSFEDNYDDSEFSGPFVVDDDDMTDPGSRACSFDQTGHPCEPHDPGGLFPMRKSRDAAVGALVRMLKKAPPLCQDVSESKTLARTPRPESLSSQVLEAAAQEPGAFMTSSGLLGSRTTADALEELRAYKEMKDLLLKQGRKF